MHKRRKKIEPVEMQAQFREEQVVSKVKYGGLTYTTNQ